MHLSTVKFLEAFIVAIIKTDGIRSDDLFLAMHMFNPQWNVELHTSTVELLISIGMLEMDSNFFITATAEAKATYALDEARRQRSNVKPNMSKAEA